MQVFVNKHHPRGFTQSINTASLDVMTWRRHDANGNAFQTQLFAIGAGGDLITALGYGESLSLQAQREFNAILDSTSLAPACHYSLDKSTLKRLRAFATTCEEESFVVFINELQLAFCIDQKGERITPYEGQECVRSENVLFFMYKNSVLHRLHPILFNM